MFAPLKKIVTIDDVRSLETVPIEERISYQNVYEAIAAPAKVDPDHPVLSYISDLEPDTKVVTWSRGFLVGKITQAANLFHSLGLSSTDVIAFLLPTVSETHVVLWGGETAAIVAPINYLLTADTIVELLNASGAKALVALGPHPDFDIWQKAVAAKAKSPGVEHFFQVTIDGLEPEAGTPEFMAAIADQPDDHLIANRRFDKKDIAALFHTGGTTGVPKLAQHSHEGQLFTAWSSVQMGHIEPGNIVLGIYPLFHVAGAFASGLSILAGGGHIVIPTATGPRNPGVLKNFWKLTERFGLTNLSGVPTILTALINHPIDADISSLQYIRTGAAPLAAETAKTIEAMTGLKIHENLGMTETSGIVSVSPRFGERVPGSAGLPMPYTYVVVRRFQGEDMPLGDECPPGENGMITYKGPNVFPGYTDPARNEGVFTEDGLLITGDLGNLNPEGWVTLTGRAKDVIIRGGHNIDPLVIESVVDKHPAVRSSVAVGQPDRYAGEVPVLFVVLKAGAQATVKELDDYLRANIDEPPARPRWVRILDELPVTGVGKIFKPTLRAIAVEDACKDALAPLADESVEFQLSAENTPTSGMVVSVEIKGVEDDAEQSKLVERVGELLGSFTLTTRTAFV